MDTMGRHVISELWECDINKLNDMDYIEKVFVDAALSAGAEVREVAFHKFAPQGVSGVVIISESHLTIHSFPEHKKVPCSLLTVQEFVASSRREGRLSIRQRSKIWLADKYGVSCFSCQETP